MGRSCSTDWNIKSYNILGTALGRNRILKWNLGNRGVKVGIRFSLRASLNTMMNLGVLYGQGISSSDG
jgi:hypothetical protein